MYRVIFQNSRQEERQIGLADDIDHANKIINKFLDDHNFKSYYTRGWMENERMCLDVGSWTEFFYIEEIKDEEK